MRPYVELAKRSFQKHLAYRAANIAGILTNGFFGMIYVFIYMALLRERGQLGGFDAHDAATYVVISQSLLMAMSAFGNRELSDSIVRGDVVTDLSRPIDFYALWAAIDLGRAMYYLIFRGIPTFAIGWVLFRVQIPRHVDTWLWFLISILAGMAVSFSFRFITNSLALWTTDARGIQYLTNTFVLFFAGFVIPLNFLPAPLQTVVHLLPFRSMAYLPISIYLGKTSGGALARALAMEAAWLVVLVLLGRLMLRRMFRRLTIHGG